MRLVDVKFLRVSALVSTLSIVVALTALVVWSTIAVAHARDTYLLNHVSGHRMALARFFNAGVFYPPLYDGLHYGGTRIMPLSILLHALAAKLTGEYLVSGRLLTYLTLVAIVAVVCGALRRFRCPLSLAAILAAAVLVIDPAYWIGFSGLLADALAVLLQVLAVSTIIDYRGRSGTFIGAAASALAFTTKFSALWAPFAIAIWFATRERTRLWPFISAYVGLVVCMMAIVGVVSNGRFFDNLFALSSAGIDGIGALLHSPTLLVRTLFGNTPALWALVPVATLAVAVSLTRRKLSIYDICLICHIPLLFLIFADIGAGENHLLDLEVLSILVIGYASSSGHSPDLDEVFAATASSRSHGLNVLQGVVALFALWITATQLVVYVPEVYSAVDILRSGNAGGHRPLDHWISPTDAILSEDPYVPVARGELPIVTDAFMLLRIGKRYPEVVQALIRRIEGREFDFVVLGAPLEQTSWWERYHFGRSVIDAIDRSYELSATAEGYYLYTPTH